MQLHTDQNFYVKRIHLSAANIQSSECKVSQLRQAPQVVGNFPDEIPEEECLLRRSDYSIRLVNSSKQRNRAGLLIKRMYSWRGYSTDGVAVMPHNPSRLTFEASRGEQLFGTLTLGIDSQEGLFADELYEQELNTFRARDRKICEVSKLAIDPQFSSKEVFASMFHLAYIYAYTIHGVKDAFIEVNPRHAAFYKRMLGFRQIGEQCMCPRVDAPAVLMHLELDYMDERISSLAGVYKLKEKSIYPYFLSRKEEKRLEDKIRLSLKRGLNT
jgi:hypothetical protein